MTTPSNNDTPPANSDKLGISGRFATYFLDSSLTPLLVLLTVLMGLFALVVTPREEEPQINVTLADVLIPFPGASVRDVEQMVVDPGEQVLARMSGIDHIVSVARPGLAIITVQFKVGLPSSEALIRLYDTLQSHSDWLPQGSGVMQPIVKPRDVDDIPALTLTLFSRNPNTGTADLARVAHSLEVELKRVPGTRDVTTIGDPGRAIRVEIDPARMRAHGVTVPDMQAAIQAANVGLPVGELLSGNRYVTVEAGEFFESAEDVGRLIVGVHDNKPVFLREVATVRDGVAVPSRYVWHGIVSKPDGAAETARSGAQEYPAVTIAISKKAGENVITVVEALLRRTEQLRNTVIPQDVEISVTRNFAVNARDKVQLLMEKLILVTVSVVALIFVALGRREAIITFFVIGFTLSMTLFAAWAFGFTLNRASLFGLVVSIGLVVDDAIVVIENIHRHTLLHPEKSLREIVPGAVDEVGGPTILATFAVIAALMPMVFITGLQGDYFRPIPAITSLGMLMSLAIAFAVTPRLAVRWMKDGAKAGKMHGGPSLAVRLVPLFTRFFAPLLDETRGKYNRGILGLIVMAAMASALALPLLHIVNLNLQPLDNKSDFEVVLDMPSGTPLESTTAVLREMSAYLATQPAVINYQIYAGTAAPVGMTGLIRQYYLRAGNEVGEIQVNLVDKHQRREKSHAMLIRLRPELARIAGRLGGHIKVFDPPAGVPTAAPIVAEVYGATADGRYQVAHAVRHAFETTPGLVDVDDSSIANARKKLLIIDNSKAALLGVTQRDIVATLRTGLHGEDISFLHDAGKYAVATTLQLPLDAHGDLDALLQLTVRSAAGHLVPISELVSVRDAQREQPVYHKDLLPVHYVLGDLDASISSPLLGMQNIRRQFASIHTPGGGRLAEYFTHLPEDPYREYSIKWDGEWQVSYETVRDLGGAYIVGLILIYLLIVSQFNSYLTPLIIMVPVPFTLIGLMVGHAVLRTDFTATSIIGLMVLAGILVRNSILLVDFINQRTAEGLPFIEAVVLSTNVRAQPIILTSLSAMVAALFLLDDPMFNGLAVALIFGNLVSTALTLVVIPTLYYAIYRRKYEKIVLRNNYV